MEEQRQSITIEDIVLYRDDLESSVSKDVFDTIVTLSSEQRKLNMRMMNVNFALSGFSNTLIGLINNESELLEPREEEEELDSDDS
tara:strand:- start:17 stop:274 length:258 start_codon:yes stop_codon:yes gene_type:complete